MAKTFKDRVKEKQKAKFIGRDEHLSLFKNNLEAQDPIAIFNIYGQGGVGKTYLSNQYKTLADENKCLTAYTDESIKSVLEWMDKVSEQFKEKKAELSEFDKRYKVYLQETKKLETDPEKPKGTFASITKTITKGLIKEGKKMPGAELIGDLIDESGIANVVGEWADFARKKMTNKDEVALVLEPLKVLSPLFWKGISNHTTQYKFVCFFVDTFEETDKVLEDWLLDTLNGEYGDIPANILLVIAGRDELNPNRWSAYSDLSQAIPLEPFTETEAEDFLTAHQITDEAVKNDILKLSSRLPVLMAFLVTTAKNSQGKLEDACETAVERFLKWVNDETQRKIALAAAIPRKLNQDVIECLLEDKSQAPKMFDWLISQPFVQKRGNYWAYHNVVREQMLRYIRTRSPKDWESRQLALADYYTTLQTNLEIAPERQFSHPKWFNFELERLYYALCANPDKNLTLSIQSLVKKWEKDGYTSADVLGEVLENVGIDNEHSIVKSWGEKIIIATHKAKKGNDDDFLQLLQDILKNNWALENNYLAFLNNWVGGFYYNKKNYTLAIKAYQRAITLQPDFAFAHNNLGLVYFDKGEYSLAIEAYQRAIYLRPDLAFIYYNLGLVYYCKEDYSLAITTVQKAVDLQSTEPIWVNLLGFLFIQIGRIKEAEEPLIKASELGNEFADMNLGHVYLSQNQEVRAIEYYQKSLAKFEDKKDFWQGMEDDFQYLEQYGITREYYEEVMKKIGER